MPNYTHLANAVQRRSRELGLDQEGLVTLSGMGRTTVQRLWAGKAVHEPSRRTKQDLERVLQWEQGSVDRVLAGGEPTVRRETPENPEADVNNSPTSARPSTLTDMPLRVQLALEEGRPLDFDVLEFEVGGRSMSIVAWAQSGVYDTEEDRAVALEQLKMFHRLMGTLRREGEGEAEDVSTTDDG